MARWQDRPQAEGTCPNRAGWRREQDRRYVRCDLRSDGSRGIWPRRGAQAQATGPGIRGGSHDRSWRHVPRQAQQRRLNPQAIAPRAKPVRLAALVAHASEARGPADGDDDQRRHGPQFTLRLEECRPRALRARSAQFGNTSGPQSGRLAEHRLAPRIRRYQVPQHARLFGEPSPSRRCDGPVESP